MNKRRPLPPLEPLIAFEAAARLLSFTAAGRELNISQAAVSQRIRQLEDRIGNPLFERIGRRVRLTAAGRDYQHSVSLALAHIADATGDVRRDRGHRRITIAADHSIAALWLMPRLDRSPLRGSGVPLRLIASDSDAECLAAGVDIAIVHGNGTWPGWSSEPLIADRIFPVCAPRYLEAHPAIATLEGLAASDLIDLEDEHWNWINWRIWLTRHGSSPAGESRPLRINAYPLIIAAARQGLGVALGWQGLVDADMAAGTLVAPVPQVLETEFGYHLARPVADEAPRAEVTAVMDWLRAERDTA